MSARVLSCLFFAAVLPALAFATTVAPSSGGTVAVNVCTGPTFDCSENCTMYAVDNGQCLTLPGAAPGTATSINITCDFTQKCVDFTEYLLNENCSTGFGPNYNTVFFADQCTTNMNKWIINANGTVSHYLNCINQTTGMCANNLSECSGFKTFTPKSCGAQQAFGLNMSYYVSGETACQSYPATYTTYFSRGDCKSGGHDQATHQTFDDSRCTAMLPFAEVSLNFKCVPKGVSLPKANPHILKLVQSKLQRLHQRHP